VATRALAHRRKQTTLAATRDLHASFPRQCHLTAAEFANGVGGQWEPSGTPMRGQRETSGTSERGNDPSAMPVAGVDTDCDLECVAKQSGEDLSTDPPFGQGLVGKPPQSVRPLLLARRNQITPRYLPVYQRTRTSDASPLCEEPANAWSRVESSRPRW